MTTKFFPIIIGVALLCLPVTNFGQVLSLGTAANFAAFTSNGAVSNTGASTLAGAIGTNLGIISGFGLPTLSGTVYNGNTITVQAKIDLLNAYIHLSDMPVTNTTHAAAFGGGETITSGVYSIAGAGSVAGMLILDGQQNPNAVFVVKFEGAFTGAAGSNIVLANQARACNIFWIAEGAISIGTSSTIKGTLIAHPGAVTIAAGSNLEGRMFSTEGAVSFGPGLASMPVGPITIPITCVNSCGNDVLGTAANFAMFSSAGAVSNAASSGFIGNIGSDAGAVTGFGTSTLVGAIYNTDAVTAQAKIDLQAAYVHLFNSTTTNASHTPAFGSGETLFRGVYSIAGAGSLAGTLTLNGQGDSNALFIFKFAGAFNTAAQSKVILINGARRCNIYWVAEGAIGMGTFTYMKGTLIAHNGANTMGANGNLEGRMLSTMGAVGFSTGVIYTTYGTCSGIVGPLPVELISFTGDCEGENVLLKWSTATEVNNKNFSVERSINGINWDLVGTIAGGINSTSPNNYALTDKLSAKSNLYYYRLKQTDLDNNFKYGNTITVKNCGATTAENVSIYPNPSTGYFNVLFTGDKNQVSSTAIFNLQGEKIYQAKGFPSKFELSDKAPGVYVIRIYLNSKIISNKIVLVK